jgi:hypothetical protein
MYSTVFGLSMASLTFVIWESPVRSDASGPLNERSAASVALERHIFLSYRPDPDVSSSQFALHSVSALEL